jgi:hypothetical protein
MPNSGVHDFMGIGGADGGDRPGGAQPALQEADIAVIFDAVHGEGIRRQAQFREDIGAELALEGKVVHGHDESECAAGRYSACRRASGRLPVMRMHDVRPPVRQSAPRAISAPASERAAKRFQLSGQSLPVASIGTARAVEEMRRIEHEEVEPLDARRRECALAAEQVVDRWRPPRAVSAAA